MYATTNALAVQKTRRLQSSSVELKVRLSQVISVLGYGDASSSCWVHSYYIEPLH